MKIEKSTSFEFALPDGWYAVRVDSPSFMENEDGSATNMIRVPFVICEGEYEGLVTSMFCNMDRNIGRTQFATLLGYTGVATALEKKFNLAGADLTPSEWGKKYLDIASEKCKKIINQAIVMLPGNYVKVELKTRQYKDRNGNDRVFQGVVGMAFYNVENTKEVEAIEEEDSW